MLYDTAARVQEICDLNTADIRAAHPTLLTLHGKGAKTRRVPLMDSTARLLEDVEAEVHPARHRETQLLEVVAVPDRFVAPVAFAEAFIPGCPDRVWRNRP